VSLDDYKNAIADEIVKRFDNDYAPYHDAFVPDWERYYYDYIGKWQTGKEPKEDWRTKEYFKFTKVKVLAAASQMISAANANSERVGTKPRDGNVEAARLMKDTINEQFERCQFQEILATAIMDVLMYGTCYIQAPAVSDVIRRRWKRSINPMGLLNGSGTFDWKAEEQVCRYPWAYNRSVYEMYPHPYASTPQDGEGFIHSTLLSKYDLSELMKKSRFDQAVIAELLRAGEEGTTAQDGVDNRKAARGYTGGVRKGYQLIFYTGKIDGQTLYDGGMQEFKDIAGYQEVWCWVIKHSLGNFLIKSERSPLSVNPRPWHSSVFERVPYEATGVGVCENMSSPAAMLQGGTRMFFDAKKLAMPMLAVNQQMLSNPSTKLVISPFKVWAFKGGDIRNAITSIQFTDVSANILQMIEFAERIADEITGIPKWQSGSANTKDYNKTAAGMSMIMSAQGQLMRTAVEGLDAMVRNIAVAFYDWNMEHNPEIRIKGDMDITTNGMAQTMQKEVMATKLLQLLSFVVNPANLQNPFALKMLRMIGDNMGIKDVDSVLPSPEQLMAPPPIPPGISVPPGAPGPPPMAGPPMGPGGPPPMRPPQPMPMVGGPR
jgi:hypothetical protein